MRSDSKNPKKETTRTPFCQATGCFSLADVYVVIKETVNADYYEAAESTNYELDRKGYSNNQEGDEQEFDGFKLILYLCNRHDNDFKYLVKGSELMISKRCNLHTPQIQESRRQAG
jgi:hypothetical protein